MYISTNTEFLKIRFLGGIEGAITNRDPNSENLMYRQSVTLNNYSKEINCSFETITNKEDFSGIFSFYTFDKTTNKVITRYFTYSVIPIK
jgi:hypothetical protein